MNASRISPRSIAAAVAKERTAPPPVRVDPERVVPREAPAMMTMMMNRGTRRQHFSEYNVTTLRPRLKA